MPYAVRTESVMVTVDTRLDQLGEADRLSIIDNVVMPRATFRTVRAALHQHR